MAFTLIEKLYFKTEFANEQTVGLAATFCNKFLVYTVCTRLGFFNFLMLHLDWLTIIIVVCGFFMQSVWFALKLSSHFL